MLQINPGEVWVCRGGCKARIYATDGWAKYPIHGAIYENNDWFDQAWQENGEYFNLLGESEYDLISKETDDENA